MIVDKFHHKNCYRAVRKRGDDKIVGMICAHCEAPCSVEEKFNCVLPPPADGGKLGEIRLYAVHPDFHRGMVPAPAGISLLLSLREQAVSELVISGIEQRKRFYERLGFRAFGEPVRHGRALFHVDARPPGRPPEPPRTGSFPPRSRARKTAHRDLTALPPRKRRQRRKKSGGSLGSGTPGAARSSTSGTQQTKSPGRTTGLQEMPLRMPSLPAMPSSRISRVWMSRTV